MRSSTPLSQRSPNLVHPMPTMATLSLIPSMVFPPKGKSNFLVYNGLSLPEIIVDAATEKHLAEGHFQKHADLHFIDIAVGKLTNHSAAALEIDNAVDARGIKGRLKLVDGIAETRPSLIGKLIGFKLILSLAVDTDARCLTDLRNLRRAALFTLCPVKGGDSFPFAPATLQRKWCTFRQCGSLQGHETAPREILPVADSGLAGKLGRNNGFFLNFLNFIGSAEDKGIGTVAVADEEDTVSWFSFFEGCRQH